MMRLAIVIMSFVTMSAEFYMLLMISVVIILISLPLIGYCSIISGITIANILKRVYPTIAFNYTLWNSFWITGIIFSTAIGILTYFSYKEWVILDLICFIMMTNLALCFGCVAAFVCGIAIAAIYRKIFSQIDFNNILLNSILTTIILFSMAIIIYMVFFSTEFPLL